MAQMIGRPRHGDMLVRSVSANTIRNAPTAAARGRVGDPAPRCLGHLGQHLQVLRLLPVRDCDCPRSLLPQYGTEVSFEGSRSKSASREPTRGGAAPA
jgi:hypothetical protein